MDKIFILMLFFYFCLAKITIKNLDVPSSISIDEQDDVVLDCEYDSQGEDVDEVKWFLDGLEQQIYQWLPKENVSAQASGKLKKYIDVNYAVTNDKYTKHRALHIIHLSTELSGNYSCKVSGFNSEDVQTKSMIIYDPGDSDLDLDITEDDDNVTITCSDEGLYPRPELRIYVSQNNESEIIAQSEVEIAELNEMELFNVSGTLVLDVDKLTSPFSYTCELTIPGTDYNVTETFIYFLESDIDTQSEEDFSIFLNSTNSTESSFKESQDSEKSTNIFQGGILIIYDCNNGKVFETQIEENIENKLKTTTTKTTESPTDKDSVDIIKEDIKDLKENASFSHLPCQSLLSSLLIMALLSPFYL